MADYNELSAISTEQLLISHELIYLLRWLMEHQSETLKKLIEKAVAQNFKLNQPSNQSIESLMSSTTEIHSPTDDLTDFFIFLESLLSDALTEKLAQQAKQKKLLATADHIDSLFDENIIRSSLEKATKKMETQPLEKPSEILLQELLKQWKTNSSGLEN